MHGSNWKCPVCKGKPLDGWDACPNCGGRGLTFEEATVEEAQLSADEMLAKLVRMQEEQRQTLAEMQTQVGCLYQFVVGLILLGFFGTLLILIAVF